MLITESQLDTWVRGNAKIAQGVIVELVWRLVAASSPQPKERRFPLGDSIGQHGSDGILEVDFPFEPFVPEGRSYWEIGTGIRPGVKATKDYNELTTAAPSDVAKDSTFIFVTPLSALFDWPNTWKEDSQTTWIKKQKKKEEWRDVRVIDGTKLVDWLHQFPAVESWLADKLGIPSLQIETLEQHWENLRSIGEPPPLSPDLFVANREAACSKIADIFAGNSVQLKLDTHFPDEVVDFVSAYVANLDSEQKVDVVGRTLIISGADAWNIITAQDGRYILIAGTQLDLQGDTGLRLLERARRAGYAVVFGGRPGGVPHPNSETIRSPRGNQIETALESAGYSEERARVLAQKSGGNIGTLLRCLQNLSLMPEWAEQSSAADLAVAVFLGSWNEDSPADQEIVESVSGKIYGEWIEAIRNIALRPGTPLTQRNGVWKFVARYEGWHALGPRVFDEHLGRLKTAAVMVLGERNPALELDPTERYAASIHGKTLRHSPQLRIGIAETLALLGSQAPALNHCSSGSAETTSVLAVRELLQSADWTQWASLDDVAPLLAEAAPKEFLGAVEASLKRDPCPFDELFGQEETGVFGRTYLSGLLWALETLAWDENLLTRVVLLLGELAARDPGGNWANRPANSLTEILLPWFPQTVASIDKRVAAVSALTNELPDVGWKLLLSLLPRSHSSSSGTRKPSWRDYIPGDWTSGVTNDEFWAQTDLYAEMAVGLSENNLEKLTELIDQLDDLPPVSQERLVAHLKSESVASMSEEDRSAIWAQLAGLVTKHRKYADSDWALPANEINRIDEVAQSLKPTSSAILHRRLFGENELDLYEEKGGYEEQQRGLNILRVRAVQEILDKDGIEGVFEFARTVDSPWRVGLALGSITDGTNERAILPDLLGDSEAAFEHLAGGYVRGKFSRLNWKWVDELDTSKWSASDTGQFFAYLPFSPEGWHRAEMRLGDNLAPYWTKAGGNPYEAEEDVEYAVDRLVENGRPLAAVRCLAVLKHSGKSFEPSRAIRVLNAALESSETSAAMDGYEIAEIIESLQEDDKTEKSDLANIEWVYLGILDRNNNAEPKELENKLAGDPSFYCEVIRLIFRSEDEAPTNAEPSDREKGAAKNAYRLLHGWRKLPGSTEEGHVEPEALSNWLSAVRSMASQTGHLSVAMINIGQVFAYSAKDPTGLWVDRSVAATLNAKDAGEMRNGFRTALYNSRGVHGFSEGAEEKQLAEEYHAKAGEVEGLGFVRLAATLRDLAQAYEREAEHESKRDPFDR